jgi:hypothetical protein
MTTAAFAETFVNSQLSMLFVLEGRIKPFGTASLPSETRNRNITIMQEG